MAMPDIAPKPRGQAPSLLDPASLLQNAQRDYDNYMQQQMKEADAFAMGQQTAAEQARAQYQMAQQAPIGNPISPMAAIPYMANAFAAGFSGRPDIAQSGERAVEGARTRQMQQRSEELSGLRESYLMAASQARESGDFAREVKFREGAEKHRGAVTVAQRAVERDADQRFTAQQRAIDRAVDEGWKAKDYGLKVWEAAASNPATRAQIETISKAFSSRLEGLYERLTQVDGKRDDQSMRVAAAVRDQITSATREYNAQMAAVRAAIGTPGAGAPNAAPPGSGVTPPSPAPTPIINTAQMAPYNPAMAGPGPAPGMVPPGTAPVSPGAAMAPQGAAPPMPQAAPMAPQGAALDMGKPPAPPESLPGRHYDTPLNFPYAGEDIPPQIAQLASQTQETSKEIEAKLNKPSATDPKKTLGELLRERGVEPRLLLGAKRQMEQRALQGALGTAVSKTSKKVQIDWIQRMLARAEGKDEVFGMLPNGEVGWVRTEFLQQQLQQLSQPTPKKAKAKG